MASSFCTAFALLGTKLLFWSSQPVTFGSVFLTACVSIAVAQLFDHGGDQALGAVWRVVNATCADPGSSVVPSGPLSLACAYLE